MLFFVLSITIVYKRGGPIKLSTRAQYATRALLDLALCQRESPVLLKDIAKRQEISLRYLEQLITPLIAAGILRTTRGPKGGVSLARPPEEIKLSEIVQLLEGSIAPVECVDNPESCHRAAFCVTRDVWNELRDAMTGVLDSITVQDLVERHKEKAQPEDKMYYI